MRNHTNTYVPNGNLTYESVSRKQYDCSMTPCITERHLSWDCKDWLHGISDNGEEDSVASMYGWFGVPYEVRHANSRGRGAHMYFPITRTDSEGNTAETSGDGSQRSHPNTLGEGLVYFYHRDHLGSMMSVTDSLGNTVQQVEYTPWGEVFVEQRSGNSDFSTPYLFNGKELDEETGLYYYGARYYDPKLSVWYSIDPMQMEYPWVSTYGYCTNNPVNRIDPNGKDEWDVNEKGIIVKHKTTTKHDAFFIVDYKGKRIKERSLFFDYGTVEKATTQMNDKGILYDVYQIRGDRSSCKLFEFLANKTSVEWSWMQTGIPGNNGLNFITSSHNHSEEVGMSELFFNQLKYGYTIRKNIHSHPENKPYPSGLVDEKKPGDIQFAQYITNVSKQNPAFQIYLPGKRKYISYGPNSTAADFNLNTLPTIIVKPKKK